MGDAGAAGVNGAETRNTKFVMASYRSTAAATCTSAAASTDKNSPRVRAASVPGTDNTSPAVARTGDDGGKAQAEPTKEELSLQGKLRTNSAAGPPPLPCASPWSPRSNSIQARPEIARYRDSADILLLRLSNTLHSLVNNTKQKNQSQEELPHSLSGEEIRNNVVEWLGCDAETAFLCASVLLQQGFIQHPSMGVFIDTAAVSYCIKDPVLVHYTRCMKQGVNGGHLKCTSKKSKAAKVEEQCFTGVDAVDWMLLNFPHLVKKLKVESVGNAVAVAEALIEQGFIENIKQKPDSKKLKPFTHDDKQLFRINNRLLKPRPVGGKMLLLSPLPAHLEFIGYTTILDGLAPIAQLTVSADSGDSTEHP